MSKTPPSQNRLNYLVQLIQRVMSAEMTQEQYWVEVLRYNYSSEERNQAGDLFKAKAARQVNSQPSPAAPRRETVTNPIAGPVSTPDWELSSEVHALGQKIAEVSTRFRQKITYVPERSRKSLRVKRLVFKPEPDTDASKIPALRYNFVAHAKLQSEASILIVPGGIEIHDPLTGEDWDRPVFKSYMRLLAEEEKIFPKNGFSFTAGLDLDGNPLKKDNVVGLMVSGATGGGKSQFLRQLTSELCLNHKPSHLKFALFDVQPSTFLGFEHSAWNFQPPCMSANHYEQGMTSVLEVVAAREKLFGEQGFSSIDQWHRERPHDAPCRVVLIVDEFGETVARLGFKAANAALTSLARVARKYGFSFVIATQTPEKSDFDPALLRALSDRVVFKAADMGASYVAFGYNDDAAMFLQGKGDGFLKAGTTPIRFQAFSMGEDDGKRQIENINNWGDHLYGPPDVSDPWEAPCVTA